MPRIPSLVPLLRPLAAPGAVACRQHFRFSTTARLRAETPSQSVQPITPSKASETSRAADLAATEAVTESDSAQPPEPKPELPSKRPQGATASKTPKRKTTSSRADEVPAPPPTPSASSTANTESALKQSSTSKTTSRRADAVPTPSPTSKRNTTASLKSAPPPSASIPLSPPRYHVSRSASKNLPIYTDYKRGGNLHLTTVRKITGDLSALRDELRVYLNKKNEDVKINDLTKHVVVKGHCKPEVQRFLEARGM